MDSETIAASNPYAATTMEVAAPPKIQRPVENWFWMLLISVNVWCVVGTAFALWDIEAIVAGGAGLLIFGLVLLIATRRGPRDAFRPVALLAAVFPIFCFVLIAAFGWTPAEAQRPVGGLCTIFAIGFVAVTFVQTSRYRRPGQEPIADPAVADAGILLDDDEVQNR